MTEVSKLDQIYGPYLRMLTASAVPIQDSSVAGELWQVCEKVGQGYVWYYPLKDLMAITVIDATYHGDVRIAYDAPDFFCFGKYNRTISDYMFDPRKISSDRNRVQSKILGYAWKQAHFSEAVCKEKPLHTTSILLVPEAVALLSARFPDEPYALASAISELDGNQMVPGLNELFDMLCNVRPGSVVAPAFYESKITEAAALLVDWRKNKQAVSPAYIRPVDRTSLNKTLNYIESHLDEALTLDTLCKLACMSTSKLTKLFKLTKGKTPMEYVRAFRMERAIKMLSLSDATLGEIATKLGFSHQGSFSESFKAVYGVPPLVYRKTHSKQYLGTENKLSVSTPTETLNARYRIS